MKWKSLFLSFFLWSPLFSKGVEQTLGIYDFSKGLDTYHSSLSLPDGFVSDSQNVLFDAQSPVSKRQGYTVAFSTGAYAYQSSWAYTDATNTSWIIVRASNSIIASNLAGAIVLISTVSANDIVGETNAFGDAYFVDPTQAVYFWNGSSTSYVSSSPHGSLITQFHNRLWVSGTAVPNGSQIYSSGFLAGNTWTLGPNATDPVQLTAGLQDNFDNVTAMYAYLDTLYLFKHYAIYSLSGFDQTSFQVSFVSSECGCIDQNSIQTFGGALKFASLRGIENFDGYRCTRISDPVKDKIDPAISIGTFSQQSWVQQTSGDFGLGSANPTFTDTTTVSSAVILFGFSEPWNNLSNWTTVSGSFSASGGLLTIPGGQSAPEIKTSSKYNVSPGFDFQTSLNFPDNTGPGMGTSLIQISLLNGSSQGYGFAVENNQFGSSTNLKLFICSPNLAGCNTSKMIGVTDTGFHSYEFQLSATGNAQLFLDGVSTLTATTAGLGVATGMNTPDISVTGGILSRQIKPFILTSSTGTYYSQVHTITGMNAWGNFSAQTFLNGGNISYFVRGSGSAFSVLSSTPAWTPQAVNSQITISTATFFQNREDFSVTLAAQDPILNSFTFQWFTGNKATQMASAVWDNRYWLSLTTSTQDSANDAVLVLANNGAWADFDIHAAGLVQYKNNLYHADSLATGNLYLDNKGYMDNGVPINAYIKTKDYTQGDLTEDNFLTSIWPSMNNSGNYNVNVFYFPDRAIAGFPLGQVAMGEFANDASVKMQIPVDLTHQVFGKTMAYLFQASDANSPWDFYGLKEIYHKRPAQ